jgi:hypothetical protein
MATLNPTDLKPNSTSGNDVDSAARVVYGLLKWINDENREISETGRAFFEERTPGPLGAV